MRIKKMLNAVLLAGALVVPTAACQPADATSQSQDQGDDEGAGFDDDGGDEGDDCDLDDQKEGDRDCGYYSSPGVWGWYYWVVLGRIGTPPANWHRPYSYPKSKSQPVPARTSGTTTRTPTGTSTKPSTTGTKSTTGTRTSSGGGSRRR